MVRQLELRDVSLEGSVCQGVAPLIDRIDSGEPSHEDRLANFELSSQLRGALASAMATLDDRERFIAERRFLTDDEDQPSLAEIGKRLGVSRERARQLETRAKRKLRPQLETHAREAGYC
jgi:RNA polymerase sigma-32 factor